jgi:predicted YcjX-like family ATPase
MPNFSHLQKAEVRDAELPYKLEQIEGAPTIWFAPGTDVNKTFQNETLRRANQRQRTRRNKLVTPDTVEASRQEDREIIAKTCAKRWDVKDADGQDVEFTYENVLEFFQALPNWIFDELRQWVTEPSTFVGGEGDNLGEA